MRYPTSESNIRKHWRLSWREALRQTFQPKNILLFLFPGQTTRRIHLAEKKKNLFSKPIVADPRCPIDFESTIESNPNLTSSFSFFFFFSLYSSPTWKCSREDEEIIFTKKRKNKRISYMQSQRYYWIERILEGKLKIVTSVELKRNSRLEVILKVKSKVKDSFPELKLTLSRDIR